MAQQNGAGAASGEVSARPEVCQLGGDRHQDSPQTNDLQFTKAQIDAASRLFEKIIGDIIGDNLEREVPDDIEQTAQNYEASHVKRRRSTKSEVEKRRAALRAIVKAMKPMTVRQVFYQATVRGIIEKSEAGYTKVQTDLVFLRRNGDLPYDWLADNTRWQRKPISYISVENAVWETAKFYRKHLWVAADSYVEIWLEKDALSGVILPVTSLYDVPLMVARGYASLSFLHSAAEHIKQLDVPAHIYHLGDFDPSGVNAAQKIEETLRELAPKAEINFERIAVTDQQIAKWNLPTRSTKKSDTRSKNFGDLSVELDAIAPNDLRALVEDVINHHLPQDQLRVLQAAEESERQLIKSFAGRIAAEEEDRLLKETLAELWPGGGAP